MQVMWRMAAYLYRRKIEAITYRLDSRICRPVISWSNGECDRKSVERAARRTWTRHRIGARVMSPAG